MTSLYESRGHRKVGGIPSAAGSSCDEGTTLTLAGYPQLLAGPLPGANPLELVGVPANHAGIATGRDAVYLEILTLSHESMTARCEPKKRKENASATNARRNSKTITPVLGVVSCCSWFTRPRAAYFPTRSPSRTHGTSEDLTPASAGERRCEEDEFYIV